MLLPFVSASRRSARKQRLDVAVRSVAESLEGRVLLSASLVKDINTVPAPSTPYGFVDDNGIALFAATDVAHGTALWRSDGTASGTSLVKSVTPEALTNINGSVYFGVAGTSADAGLWKTDGTTAGTIRLIPFGPVGVSGNVTSIIGVGNKIFFIAGPVGYTGESALWVSDGTPGGTHSLIAGVLRGTQSGQVNPDFGVLGGQVYVISDASGGPALYRTDGSTTRLVKAIQLDPTYGEAAVGTAAGRVYFADLENGINELWETDGTAAGTAQVTTGTLGLGPQPIPPVEFDGAAYFLGRDATGIGLWKTDGTPGNTTLIDRRALFTAVASGPYLYYRGHSSATSDDLFRTDGTAAGVVQLTSLSAHDFPFELADVGGTLFFSTLSDQLWKSDGTPAGTVLLNPSLYVDAIADIHGTAFLGGNGQLWKSNGTAAGTQLVKLINPATLSSDPSSAIDVNDELFFSADDGAHGRQLWKSDGTDAGTDLVKQLEPGADYTSQYELTNVNGTVYFLEQNSSDPSSYVTTLYRSDGTAAGTVPVKQLQLGPLGDSTPPQYQDAQLTAVGGALYFFEADANGTTIWQTTPASSTASEVATLPQGVFPYKLISFGGKLLLNAFDNSSFSAKLFVLQGSSLVALGPEAVSGDAFNGEFYYLTWQPSPQTDARFPILYRTDGTTAGTVQVQQFPNDQVNYLGPDPKLYADAGMLLFSVPSGVWVSNGTAATSHRVASNLQLLEPPVVFNGQVYFIASDPTQSNVRQLWRTDGTSAGTVLVKDSLGNQFQDVQLAALADKVYFTAWEPMTYWQLLWQTDGTPFGTQPVPGVANDLRPNFGNLTSILGTSGGKLYFSPEDPLHGQELWKVESGPPPLVVRGTGANDTITLSVAAGGILQATVNGNTSSYTAAQYAGGITIDTGGSSTGDLLNIVGLPPVDVHVQSEGPLSAHVGGGGSGMQDVAATNLTIGAASAAQGKISLTLDDGADPAARSVALDAESFQNTAYGTVTGLSAGTIAFNAQQTLSPLTIYGGGGGNSITVKHTPAGTINLSTGAGNDTVNVLAIAAGTVLNVNGKSGTDVVNVGGSNQHSVQDVSGVVNVSNPLGQTHLTIDDSADSTPRTATLDTFTAGADVYGSLTGLSPGPINFDSTQIASPVVINAGVDANHFLVKETPPATVVNLNTGIASDTVNVRATSAGSVLNINGQAGHDQVNINDPTAGMQNIRGVVNVSNPLGQTAITVDNTDGRNGDLTLDTFDAAGATWGTLQGLAAGVINFSSVGLGSLTVTAGGTSTGLTVNNTPGGGPINFGRIALVEVMGVAAGQSLSISFGTPDVISANIDLYTGRIAGGVFVDADELNIRGAAGQTYQGLGAAYNEDSLADINVTGGTYVLPDLDLTFGHSGITFDGSDTHAVFSQTEHLEPLALMNGATATLAPGSDLFCRGLTLDGKLDIGTNQVMDSSDSTQQINTWIKSGLAAPIPIGTRATSTTTAKSISPTC